MQPQRRIRKMRQHGRHHGRSTDGIRQNYYDEKIRRARGVVRVTAPKPTPAPEPESEGQ
jgi:hypothetical protein